MSQISSSGPRKSIQDIRAQFEARSETILPQPKITPNLYKRSNSADISTFLKRTQSAVRHIDTTLEPSPSSEAVPPSTSDPLAASTRPSWIGPESPHPRKSSSFAMKKAVTIEFFSPGLKPPVFVGTSLTKRRWEPLEMQFDIVELGEFHFHRTFEAEEGEYQYKLRLGSGDWWVCDESKPTVDDGAGNKNNVVKVKRENIARPEDYVDEDPSSPTFGRVIDGVHHIPLFKHETEVVVSPRLKFDESSDEDDSTEEEHLAPLLPHESMTSKEVEEISRQSSNGGPERRFSVNNHRRTSSPASRRSSYQDPCPEEIAVYGNAPPVPEEQRQRDSLALYRLSFKLCPPSDRTEGSPPKVLGAKGPQLLPSVQEDDEPDESTRADSITEEKMSDAKIFAVKVAAIDQGIANITPPVTPPVEKSESGRIGDQGSMPPVLVSHTENDSKSETEGEDEKAVQPRENSLAAIALGLGFAFAVAATAIGISLMPSKD